MLLDELMKILNLRYDNTEYLIELSEDDIKFKTDVGEILNNLGENRYLLPFIMKSGFLLKFMAINLRFQREHLSVIQNMTNFLSKVTQDDYSLSLFAS